MAKETYEDDTGAKKHFEECMALILRKLTMVSSNMLEKETCQKVVGHWTVRGEREDKRKLGDGRVLCICLHRRRPWPNDPSCARNEILKHIDKKVLLREN